MSWSRRSVSLIALSLLGVTANAQTGLTAELARPWMLAFSVLRDEDSYENLIASFHYGFSDVTWLSLAAGRSRAPSVETDVRADLLSLGLEHDFGPIGLALTAEQWGDENNLESRNWLGRIFFGGDRFRIDLMREQRDIDIYFSGAGAPVLTDLRRVNVNANGTGLAWRYRFAPLWRTYGSWMGYDYPRRIGLVPRANRLDLLSTSTVTLAYSFVDHVESIGLERAVGEKLINVDYSQDRSTIGDGQLKSVSTSVLWPVGRRMDLEWRLGSSRADAFGSSLYGGLTILIYGGR